MKEDVTVSEQEDYVCPCGFRGTVLVMGEAVANLKGDGSAADDRAMQSAAKSAGRDARSKLRILPCPSCHRRRPGLAAAFLIERILTFSVLAAAAFAVFYFRDALGAAIGGMTFWLLVGLAAAAVGSATLSVKQWVGAARAAATVQPAAQEATGAPERPC